MPGRPLLLAPALAGLSCAIVAGCAAGHSPGADHHATPSSTVASRQPSARQIGSPGHPLPLSCAEESFPGSGEPPLPVQPQPGDLVIGPLSIVNGERLAEADPAGYGEHGAYKIPFVVRPGMSVTVTIAASARGQVVIDSPYSPVGGVAAATYQSCSHLTGFFAQGFSFTHGQTRGCVPLEVRAGHQRQVRRVTLSLFAGSCSR
jgi:hypothetical protein